ncbi:hypothetical protein [Desulfuribacillus alkaliarsenatis]|uniref:Uncharacterized protein n=1 Tax=Desulfuribacillus alkaliarsenatis TaxID=766136 RepID=A0A1E5G3V2_9FIRM|nr:hypothetical protein [Desulfuribacillus alkaliarsenatis]OEF97760.1 hypothetical protein BHF68_13805 [Desulfuribacillus alkaliarsenatis]
MFEWLPWAAERVLAMFIGITFLLIGIQVTLFHYRQNLNKWVMWGPVIFTPIMFIVAATYALRPTEWLFWFYAIMLAIGFLDGLIGFFYHVKGVGLRVDGYKLRNFLIGPPIILPLLFVALTGLGMMSIYQQVLNNFAYVLTWWS